MRRPIIAYEEEPEAIVSAVSVAAEAKETVGSNLGGGAFVVEVMGVVVIVVFGVSEIVVLQNSRKQLQVV